MFADAYEVAARFTLPLVISYRRYDGEVGTGVATFVVVNDAGWAVTAGHAFDVHLAAQRHQAETARGAAPEPDWIRNVSYWWSGDGVGVEAVHLLGPADLAVVRLDGLDLAGIGEYPVFKRGDGMRPGTSLCRLGFPFHQLEATYDEAREAFELPPGAVPMARFPNEGIYTRTALAQVPPGEEKPYPIKFVETSSPGLKGQSGGPIFDRAGRVWGVQSRTIHLPLGFAPVVDVGGREVPEHQFINVGWAVHAETVCGFLTELGVAFRAEGPQAGASS